jgi:proline racemase
MLNRPEPPISIVCVHAEGEIGDVIISGIPDPIHCTTMYEKLVHFETKADSYRQLLMQEPRGRVSQCMNLLLTPCDPQADAGFLTLESDEYATMSGSNTICVTTVLLETGRIPMKEPETRVVLDTAAGLVRVRARCAGGKCTSVEFDNVPAFVYELDLPVCVPGIGEITVDVAWGGMHYAIVSADSVGLSISHEHGADLIRIGEAIRKSVQDVYEPVHPLNSGIRGVSTMQFTEPLDAELAVQEEADGTVVKAKTARNTVVVSPGRLDRSPCGTGTSARMAILHARGQLGVGEAFTHKSIIGTKFQCSIMGTTKVGKYDAILPRVRGRAWITGYRQVVVDVEDPFPLGFRVGDVWGPDCGGAGTAVDS